MTAQQMLAAKDGMEAMAARCPVEMQVELSELLKLLYALADLMEDWAVRAQVYEEGGKVVN